MALSFNRPDETPVPLFTAPCRLWLTLDGRVVEDGDLDAHQLLIRAGGTIPLADAIRYGLVALAAPEPEQPAVEPAAEAEQPAAVEAPAPEPEASPEQPATDAAVEPEQPAPAPEA